jgi:hypothetical protein
MAVVVYAAVFRAEPPPFPAQIPMPTGVSVVSVENDGSAVCAGGNCEEKRYTFSSLEPVSTLCPQVATAVESWAGATLRPVQGSECAASGTAQGWRVFVGIDRPADAEPQVSRILVTATHMG